MTDHAHPDIDRLRQGEVSACPCCGSVYGTTLSRAPALLGVSDVLVVRALEAVGKRIARVDRPRFGTLTHNKIPFHQAHTKWKPEPRMVDRSLAGAWDVVPAMLTSHGCCGVTAGQLTRVLDQYVRDLLITGTPHDLSELRYRFEKYLGIPLVEPQPFEPPPGDDPPISAVGHG